MFGELHFDTRKPSGRPLVLAEIVPSQEDIVAQGVAQKPEQDIEHFARHLCHFLRKPQQHTRQNHAETHKDEPFRMSLQVLFHHAEIIGEILADGFCDGLLFFLRQGVFNEFQDKGVFGRYHLGGYFKILHEARIQCLKTLDAIGADDIVVVGNAAGNGGDSITDIILHHS